MGAFIIIKIPLFMPTKFSPSLGLEHIQFEFDTPFFPHYFSFQAKLLRMYVRLIPRIVHVKGVCIC